jgi:DNA-directed RNA polymerase specialized sigma24 family protein
MSYSTTSLPQMEREQLTMSLLEQFTPYLRQSARSGRLDFEELYQDASIKIMQILDHYRDQVRHLHAYVSMAMHNLVIDKVNYAKKRRAVSLDEPLWNDVSFTLGDLLPDPYRVEPVMVLLAQERLEALQSRVASAKHHGTRRMLREMHATALAVVSVDDYQLVQARD